MSKTKNDHHNKGQTDASNGTHNPPNDLIDEVIGFFFKGNDSYRQMHEENAAYDQGQKNHRSQK